MRNQAIVPHSTIIYFSLSQARRHRNKLTFFVAAHTSTAWSPNKFFFHKSYLNVLT